MDNYKVTWLFEYCYIVATCNADHRESAIDLATDWVVESLPLDSEQLDKAIDVIVEYIGEKQ